MSLPIVSVPNVKTGDVFYVVTREGKFLAVRIKKSYINIPEKLVICDLEFPKGIEIRFGTAINKCGVRATCYGNGEIRLVMDTPYIVSYNPVFTCIYKTLDDARNGIIYNDRIDLYSLPCYPEDFKEIDLSDHLKIKTSQWGYSTQSLTPTTIWKTFKYVEFYEDGFRLLQDDLTPMGECGFKSLEDVVTFLDKKRKKMEVVGFDDEEENTKAPETKTISIEITKNTTALELAEKIIAESKGTWK